MIEPWERDWSGLSPWREFPAAEPVLAGMLRHASKHHRDKPVLVLDDRVLSYGQLDARSALLARHMLDAGCGRGTRIGVMLPNEPSFLISWFAIVRIGAVAVTLPSLAKPPEIAKIARHADLHMLIAPRRYLHHDYLPRLAEAFPGIDRQRAPVRIEATPFLRDMWLWCEELSDCPAWARAINLSAPPVSGEALLASVEASVHSSDPAGIIYTSGSTAEPKGVIHSQGSFVRQGYKLAASFGYGPDERAFATMPFFWVGGLTTTLMCLMSVGGTVLASRKADTELLDFIEAQRTTAVVAWPHIMRNLADDPSFAARDWSAMRNGLFYEALPPGRRPAELSLLGTPIGMTETNGPYTIIDRFLGEEQRGSLGRLMPGMQARLIDPDTGETIVESGEDSRHLDSAGHVGVLHLRSDTMMLGMVKREAADVFTRDGWYDSCDLVSFSDGHFHYHGRSDDLIKAHGANVSPREVEEVLASLPGVAAAYAIGVPDRERGTVVGAVVVAEPGTDLDAEAIKRRASESLASYKAPRILVVRAASELPVLPSSKVDRRGLAALLAEKPLKP